MPYFPQATIVTSTTGWNTAAAHVPLQSIVNFALCMARAFGTPPPPSGVALVLIFVDATSLWKASSTRPDVWVDVRGVCLQSEALVLMVLHGWGGISRPF